MTEKKSRGRYKEKFAQFKVGKFSNPYYLSGIFP